MRFLALRLPHGRIERAHSARWQPNASAAKFGQDGFAFESWVWGSAVWFMLIDDTMCVCAGTGTVIIIVIRTLYWQFALNKNMGNAATDLWLHTNMHAHAHSHARPAAGSASALVRRNVI